MLEPGQLVMLLNAKDKRYFVSAQEGQVMHTNEGILHLDEVRAAGWGQQVLTHKGYPFTVMRPTLYDLIKSVKRRSQIIYPKEIGYIAMKLGIGPGCRIVEAGCGSGGLTTALAWLVGDTGKVYTYERREEFYTLCRQNLERIGLSHRVEQFHHDIAEGFHPHAADALFLLLPLLAALLVVAVLAPLALGGWTFSTEALALKPERLNPVKGLARVFSLNGLAELAKALAELLDAPQSLAAMGRAARDRVLERFSQDRFETTGAEIVRRIETLISRH